MKISQLFKDRTALDIFAVLARWLVGGVFLYMGLLKALHPVVFLKLLRQYDLTNSPFLFNFIATALPWFETFCGLLLLAGIAVRGTALILTLMLVPFTLLVLHHALFLQSVQNIPFCAIIFDCGCGPGRTYVCHKLTENVILLGLSLWLVFGYGRRFSLRFSVMNSPAA